MIINFVGDIMLIDVKNDPFSKVRKFFKPDDLTIGNLECVLKGSDGVLEKKAWAFSSSMADIEYLNSIKINIVSLANNHIYDNLKDGFLKTIDFLETNSIKYLGAGITRGQAEAPLLVRKENKQYGFLNYVTQDTNPGISEYPEFFVNWYNPEKVKNDIISLKRKVDFVILLIHWGGKFEGGYYPDRHQYRDAKSFIESGADLIIGHHSHTFQPFERINKKYVFYSLGNFLGSTNYIGGGRFTRRMNSAIVKVNMEANDNLISIIPIKNSNGVLSQAPLKNLQKLKRRNMINSVLKKSVFAWYIYYAHFKVIEPFCYYFFGYDRSTIKKLRSLNINKIATYFLRIFE